MGQVTCKSQPFEIFLVHPTVDIHFAKIKNKKNQVSYGRRPKEVSYRSLCWVGVAGCVILDQLQWVLNCYVESRIQHEGGLQWCVEWWCGWKRGWMNSTSLIWRERDSCHASVGQKRRVQHTRGQQRVKLQEVERESVLWITWDTCSVLIGCLNSYHFNN